VTAVAGGDLEQNLTVRPRAKWRHSDTINNMTGTLATFADQVTSVAREVGVEGRLGGRPTCLARPARGGRQRQPAGRQPHHAGARHRRGRDRRDEAT
jgi:hypothetical protein